MPTPITTANATACSLTVYNDGFALVKDTRKVPEISEDDMVHFTEVARRIETDSIIIEGMDVSELEYSFDLLDQQSLLEKYVGREVKVYGSLDRDGRLYMLLRPGNPLVLQDVETGEIVLDPRGEIRFPENPDGLHAKPTLVWKVAEKRESEVCVSYLTDGVKWEADYVISLHGDKFDLSAWLTMTNVSGVAFKDANLRLISGTLNKAGNEDQKTGNQELSPKGGGKQSDSFSDFHTYTFPTPITLENRQQKLLRLLSSAGSKAQTIYEVNNQSSNPDIYIEFENTEENGLGFPLPEGTFKMYRTNPVDGSAEFIGEDRIKHTEVNKKVRLKSGEACDIKVESKESGKYKEGGYEYTEYQYKIVNTKGEPIEALIRQQVPGRLWTVDESSHEWEKKQNNILLPVNVAVDQEETVKFTIRHDRSARRTIGF
ncbi:DUF4139 domain-containing protein [Sporosarcina sp. NCCP-2222]|uniref:DUF4139 domain-containing protein n=1 Tax=Sporosarcina sp. NCCP-2222 TaxID=2935073 RepID=UPI0020866D37|nr:DUF4139 domain-containing protein [Sporosarcina sp. NCCP-2222]GKV56169.1 DUF4139 domain-containing protein [Sporosarcina sp. NCCP-2222]